MISPEELAKRKAADPDALAFAEVELGAACALCSWGCDAAPTELLEARVNEHLTKCHELGNLARVDEHGNALAYDVPEELGSFKAAPASCRACGYRWVAVVDVEDGTPDLECPKCNRPAGGFLGKTK